MSWQRYLPKKQLTMNLRKMGSKASTLKLTILVGNLVWKFSEVFFFQWKWLLLIVSKIFGNLVFNRTSMVSYYWCIPISATEIRPLLLLVVVSDNGWILVIGDIVITCNHLFSLHKLWPMCKMVLLSYQVILISHRILLASWITM